ncbi:hypothetical protein HN511_02785 [bacterium]|nr:hypothetical protein [bacterium]
MINKIRIIFISIIYIPLAFIFCLIWGETNAVLGTLLGTFQDWSSLIKQGYHEWRYTPQLAAHNDCVTSSIPLEEKIKMLEEIEQKKRTTQHPISFVVHATVLCTVLLPIRLFFAVLLGPVFAGEDAWAFFQKHILKQEKELLAKDIFPEGERI